MNVGDYVRTKYGKIGKIIDFEKALVFKPITFKEELEDIKSEEIMIVADTNYYFDDEKDNYSKSDIIKSSPSIINLIQVRRLCEWRRSNKCWQKMVRYDK